MLPWQVLPRTANPRCCGPSGRVKLFPLSRSELCGAEKLIQKVLREGRILPAGSQRCPIGVCSTGDPGLGEGEGQEEQGSPHGDRGRGSSQGSDTLGTKQSSLEGHRTDSVPSKRPLRPRTGRRWLSGASRCHSPPCRAGSAASTLLQGDLSWGLGSLGCQSTGVSLQPLYFRVSSASTSRGLKAALFL